jgi:phosphatidylglycerophosphate synthase
MDTQQEHLINVQPILFLRLYLIKGSKFGAILDMITDRYILNRFILECTHALHLEHQHHVSSWYWVSFILSTRGSSSDW